MFGIFLSEIFQSRRRESNDRLSVQAALPPLPPLPPCRDYEKRETYVIENARTTSQTYVTLIPGGAMQSVLLWQDLTSCDRNIDGFGYQAF